MKCHILFSEKNIINLLSVENAQRVVKVNVEHTRTVFMTFPHSSYVFLKVVVVNVGERGSK